MYFFNLDVPISWFIIVGQCWYSILSPIGSLCRTTVLFSSPCLIAGGSGGCADLIGLGQGAD